MPCAVSPTIGQCELSFICCDFQTRNAIVNIHIHLNWIGDEQVVLVVHDKTCRYKQSLSRRHFMSKLFPL
jgi:hypothetical protein